MADPDTAAMHDALRPISTAVDAQLQVRRACVRACVRAYRAVPCRAARGRAQGRLPQALADVFVKGEWSPQVAIQKMEYQLEKHNANVRLVMQASVDSLVEHWMRDLDELQRVSLANVSPSCSRPR